MPLRRKKPTVRDTLEHTYDELRQQVAEKAPVLRDQVATKLSEGAEEARVRLPELQATLVEHLPDTEALKKSARKASKKASKRAAKLSGRKQEKSGGKVKKLAIVGVLAGIGGVVYSRLKNATDGPTYTPPATRPTPSPGGSHAAPVADPQLTEPGVTPVPDDVAELADEVAPDTVQNPDTEQIPDADK